MSSANICLLRYTQAIYVEFITRCGSCKFYFMESTVAEKLNVVRQKNYNFCADAANSFEVLLNRLLYA